MDKKSIRTKIKELKSLLSGEEIQKRSRIMAENLFELPEYKEAGNVFVYLSFNQEVDTEPVIRKALADGKKVAVPRVIPEDEYGRKLPLNEQTMEFIYIDENTAYTEHGGIREPVSGDVADSDALVIVPGLAFGKDLNRIGYGGGFYDRYFAEHEDRTFMKTALCYDFQVFDSLPSDAHDAKVDILIVG